jgi:superfamily II DNA or RNA helicase
MTAHWSLEPSEGALVSLPTGTGKTAVALAAPFLTPDAPTRVLVLVPSRAIRDQISTQFKTLDVLRSINALPKDIDQPVVQDIAGYSQDWQRLKHCDVVIGIPHSLGVDATGPTVQSVPPEFFDLVIVDEAHHLPARTWTAVLEHLEYRYAVLLTATPFRLDRRPVPGERVYTYPLQLAIANDFYAPVEPIILPAPDPITEHNKDSIIAHEVIRLAAAERHESSAVLIRARTRTRANALADLYTSLGLPTEALVSTMSPEDQDSVTDRLKSGELRSVAVVGMLGEGFDVPRLRIVGYHDKHRSLPATVQLIGRLARVDSRYPQPSMLVTVGDAEVYPELQEVVRTLYDEDANWATLLPGLIDAHIASDATNRAFIGDLHEQEVAERPIDPHALRPMPGPVIYQVEPSATIDFVDALRDQFEVGEDLAGARIIARFRHHDSLVAFITRRRERPSWIDDPTIENIEYGISLISLRQPNRSALPPLLFVDAADNRIQKAAIEALGVADQLRPIDTARLDGYLQSLQRISVSAVGMRNILAGTSGTSYRTRAGRSTDTDIISVETTQTALGHIMMQVNTDGGSTTIGGAFEKGKIWQRSYLPLVQYDAWVTGAAQLLWFPTGGNSAALLPQIARGRDLDRWPNARPLGAELHQALSVGGYRLVDGGGDDIGTIEDFTLWPGYDPVDQIVLPRPDDQTLPVVGVMTMRDTDRIAVAWSGTFHPDGSVRTAQHDLHVRRGYQQVSTLSELLEEYPPLIYFVNGLAVQGRELFDVEGGSTPRFSNRDIEAITWDDYNIRAETRKTAAERGLGGSVHERLEAYLIDQPFDGRYRWILCNDGTGEIADYIDIGYTPEGRVRLALWHAKGAGGDPGLRVNDFQVVTAQAIRSRSWFNDLELWTRLRERVMGREYPPARIVAGSSCKRLLVFLGEQRQGMQRRQLSWPRTRPLVQGEIGIVQPGLGRKMFLDEGPQTPGTTANSLQQMFTVLGDTVAVTGGRAIILCSP